MHQLGVGEGGAGDGQLFAGAQDGSLGGAAQLMSQAVADAALVQLVGAETAADDVHEDPLGHVDDVLGDVFVLQAGGVFHQRRGHIIGKFHYEFPPS